MGLFTVTFDFGEGVFTGAERWLLLSVKTNGAVNFTPLLPLQKITATPYAITANHLNGPLSGDNLSGTYTNALTLNNGANSFRGNGTGLTGLNASNLTDAIADARLSRVSFQRYWRSYYQSLFSMFYSSVRIRRQRNANEFLIVSSINILMSKGGGSPGDLSTAKRRGWFDQLRAADFLVATGRQTGLDQFAPVAKKKSRIPVYGHVNARSIYQPGHGTGLPDFLTGGRLQANEIPARFGAVNIITQQHTGGGIA
jgi:hypothetical protein